MAKTTKKKGRTSRTESDAPAPREKATAQEEKDFLWSYFRLNAEQRLKVFNFFVIFSIFAAGGIFTAFEKDAHPIILMLIGLFVAGLAVVFWLLDNRTRELLREALPGLKRYERERLRKDARVFVRDAAPGHKSFTNVFRSLFVVQVVFGLAVAVCGLTRWVCETC